MEFFNFLSIGSIFFIFGKMKLQFCLITKISKFYSHIKITSRGFEATLGTSNLFSCFQKKTREIFSKNRGFKCYFTKTNKTMMI